MNSSTMVRHTIFVHCDFIRCSNFTDFDGLCLIEFNVEWPNIGAFDVEKLISEKIGLRLIGGNMNAVASERAHFEIQIDNDAD